jgi:predicted small integral membrane protein
MAPVFLDTVEGYICPECWGEWVSWEGASAAFFLKLLLATLLNQLERINVFSSCGQALAGNGKINTAVGDTLKVRLSHQRDSPGITISILTTWHSF